VLQCFEKSKSDFERAKVDTLKNVNDFIDDQPDYVPELEIVHFLNLLKNVGFDKVKERIVTPLRGLKVAPYYGCALLRPDRPEGVPIDDPENPTVIEDLIRSIGAEPVEFPFRTECCGNYHIVFEPSIVEMRTKKIIGSARLGKADVILSPCPLCTYNLQHGNEILDRSEQVPVVFFTQLLALSLGVKSHLSTEIQNQIMKKIGGEKFV